jgi:DNA polymerase elongation subunit (family B)
LVIIIDNGSFFDFPTFRKGRKRDNIWMVLYKEKRDVNKAVMQKMSNKHRESIKSYLGERIGGAIWFYPTRGRNRIFFAEGGNFSDKLF